MPRRLTLFLVKFIDNASYAEQLLDGRVFASRLATFIRVEDNDTSSARQDRNEATVAFHQPDRIDLEINGRNMTSDLAGPLQIQSDSLSFLNVFCVYAAQIDDIESNQIPIEDSEEFRTRLAVPSSCFSLGKHAIVIMNVPEFIQRLGESASSSGYKMWYGRVNYYDPAHFHGNFFGIDGAFWKQQNYSYQCEFRFVFDTHTCEDTALILNIGDIRDIAFQVPSVELNRELLGVT